MTLNTHHIFADSTKKKFGFFPWCLDNFLPKLKIFFDKNSEKIQIEVNQVSLFEAPKIAKKQS
jgi:hypothetical protein